MNTNKSIKCAIGRHHWQPTPVAGMHERICLDCGSARFDASIHPNHEARSAAVSASGLPSHTPSLTVDSAVEGSRRRVRRRFCLTTIVREADRCRDLGWCCRVIARPNKET